MFKKNLIAIAAVGLISAFGVGAALAAGPQGFKNVPADQRGYLLTAEKVTITGTIVAAELTPPYPTIDVKDATGTVTTVVLGPFWYLSQQGLSPRVGDAVKVTGAVGYDKKFVAFSLEAGGKAYTLRNDGMPMPAAAGGRGAARMGGGRWNTSTDTNTSANTAAAPFGGFRGRGAPLRIHWPAPAPAAPAE